MSNLQLVNFRDIDLNDIFFDSLRESYREFDDWFRRKSDEKAYIIVNDRKELDGFLYLKLENGPIIDVKPIIDAEVVLKIGTFKINPHSTRLGERFIKKSLDHAIVAKADICYVTLFEKHEALLNLFIRYGFIKHGTKETSNGTEIVLTKNMKMLRKDTLLDYPLFNPTNNKKFLLAIYPDYHTKLFPDSILATESIDILEDVSHTNSIHKIYVCGMPVYKAKPGDLIVIYRTGDKIAPAEYRAVATSICVVEEVKSKSDFPTFNSFYDYANTYSIFDKGSLIDWYRKNSFYTIKMTYNAALTKRLTRQRLADEVGLDRGLRWGFIELTDEQFYKIVELGEVNEGIIID